MNVDTQGGSLSVFMCCVTVNTGAWVLDEGCVQFPAPPVLNPLRSPHAVLYNGCADTACPSRFKASFLSLSLSTAYCLVFFIIAILTGAGYFSVVFLFTFIFLMINSVEDIAMSFLVTAFHL